MTVYEKVYVEDFYNLTKFLEFAKNINMSPALLAHHVMLYQWNMFQRLS